MSEEMKTKQVSEAGQTKPDFIRHHGVKLITLTMFAVGALLTRHNAYVGVPVVSAIAGPLLSDFIAKRRNSEEHTKKGASNWDRRIAMGMASFVCTVFVSGVQFAKDYPVSKETPLDRATAAIQEKIRYCEESGACVGISPATVADGYIVEAPDFNVATTNVKRILVTRQNTVTGRSETGVSVTADLAGNYKESRVSVFTLQTETSTRNFVGERVTVFVPTPQSRKRVRSVSSYHQ